MALPIQVYSKEETNLFSNKKIKKKRKNASWDNCQMA